VLSGADILRLPGREPVVADPLIREARDRQWRRRRRLFLIAVLLFFAAVAIYGGFRPGGGASPPSGLTALHPAEMPHQAGWYVGASRVATPGCKDCVQLASWASTVPYLDQPGDFPQHTMVTLGRDDVIVWMTRSWQPVTTALRWMLKRHSLRIVPGIIRAGFEGNPAPSRVSEWGSATWRSGSFVSVYVFFGSPKPTVATIGRAQSEITRARFPPWHLRSTAK
jgi:hypothetical protein